MGEHPMGEDRHPLKTLRSLLSSRFNNDAADVDHAESLSALGYRRAARLGQTSHEAAFRLHDDGLLGLETDALLDPLRKEPRFQTVVRELKFPN